MCGDHVMRNPKPAAPTRILHLTHPSRKGSGAPASLEGVDPLDFQTSDTLPCVRLVFFEETGDLRIKEGPVSLIRF